MSARAVYPASDDGLALGSTNNNWSDLYIADSGVINLGDDQDVTLAHVADAGILLGSTKYLSFSDANSHISSPGAGTNNDFYPGGTLQQIKFEYNITADDLITVIIRGTPE